MVINPAKMTSGKDPPPSFQTSEQALNTVSLFVALFVMLPRLSALRIGWHHGYQALRMGQLPCGIAFAGAVHQQRNPPVVLSHGCNQLSALGRITGLTWRQTPGDDVACICGNHMNFCTPSAPAASDALRAVFFSAPVPSGCTFTMVESKLTDSMRTRIRRLCCSSGNTLSSTPAWLQRAMRR